MEHNNPIQTISFVMLQDVPTQQRPNKNSHPLSHCCDATIQKTQITREEGRIQVPVDVAKLSFVDGLFLDDDIVNEG